ncbi:polysaccharide deacetylase family protein [Longispora fulva]|uniref:Peptidoglycan/xylan/chitin deacetylase (PgdA/CDA1 family) n=1 Tax=Longispora fulva TaxID=619741 RepID=A0A8J7GGS4_9ACTN|nr:polysaccharide deacetylase family protein [Longispora fulva]MBG6138729.1 peptidoglycan/xylan/chitin deacetylase (PgdA/CDA1 family) [Longispora fulva]
MAALAIVVVLGGAWAGGVAGRSRREALWQPAGPMTPTLAPSPTPSPTPSPSPSPSASPSAQAPAPPVADGPSGAMRFTGTSAVALTFDDGPDPVNTPRILDILKQNGVKATFCLVGFRARDHPELVRRIAAEGHSLCNHSWQHLLDLAKHDDGYIRADLQRTNDAIHNAAPGVPITLFRAPGGNFTPGLVAMARQMGMRSAYWDVDPRDWESAKYGTGGPMIEHVVGAVNSSTRPGSIVLSHDNGKPDTIEAYRRLIPTLKNRFTLVPL